MGKLLAKYRDLSPMMRASFWFLACGVLQRGISVITTPIFTRLLSTSEYGQYNVFNSWLGIAQVIVTLNLCYGVYTQGLVKFEDRRAVFSSSLQGLSLTLTSAWTIVYLLTRDFWNGAMGLTTPQVLCMLSMCWTGTVFNFWASDQRVDLKYQKLVCVTLLTSLAKPILGIVLVLHASDKVTARIFGLAIVELAAYSWMFFSQEARGKKFFDAGFWKYALAFNIPLVPHYLSQVVLQSADRIMILDMVGASEAGIYGLAYSISQIMTILNGALSQTLEPWFYKKIKQRDLESMGNVTYLSVGMIAAANLIVIAFAPEVVAIFAPPEYQEGIWVVPPVTMSVYFMVFLSIFGPFEFYFEKTKMIAAATVVGAAMNIILNLLLIPRFGYIAAGYTTLVCYILFALFHFLFMSKISRDNFNGRTPYNWKVFASMSAAFVLLGFGIMATYPVPVLRYGILVAALITAIIKRKWIAEQVRMILSLRKTRKEEG